MTRARWEILLPPTLTLLAVLLLWQALVSLAQVPEYLVPAPGAVLAEAQAQRSLLLSACGVTFTEAAAGFGTSALLGTLTAFLVTRARWIERAAMPYAVFLQTVPIVAIAPLLVMWFGVGPRAVIAASTLVAIFPIITGVSTGLKSVDPELRGLFRLYGASRWQTFFQLEIPSALPYLLAGLRSSGGLAVVGAVVGEFVAGHPEGSPGLGYVLLSSYRQLQTPLLFAAIFGCTLLGLALFTVVTAAERRLLGRWHASALT